MSFESQISPSTLACNVPHLLCIGKTIAVLFGGIMFSKFVALELHRTGKKFDEHDKSDFQQAGGPHTHQLYWKRTYFLWQMQVKSSSSMMSFCFKSHSAVYGLMQGKEKSCTRCRCSTVVNSQCFVDTCEKACREAKRRLFNSWKNAQYINTYSCVVSIQLCLVSILSSTPDSDRITLVLVPAYLRIHHH